MALRCTSQWAVPMLLAVELIDKPYSRCVHAGVRHDGNCTRLARSPAF